MVEKLSDIYLFEKHDKPTVKRWVNALAYGFFKRAWGGHANDGDHFGIWFTYQSRKELFYILEALSIELKRIPNDDPKPVAGKPYSFAEFEKFKREIKDYPGFEQPLHIKIAGIPCFVWIEKGRISLSLSGAADGNRYDVSEKDFENCMIIEQLVADKELSPYVSNDYEQWVTHISRKKYPELFDE